MDMYESAASDEVVIDTFSLSDIYLYTDPSSSSSSQQKQAADQLQEHGNSSFTFKFSTGASVQPVLHDQETVLVGNVFALPKSNLSPHRSRMKTFPVNDKSGGGDEQFRLGGKVVNLTVRPRRRSAGREFLMPGLGGSSATIQKFGLRGTKDHGSLRRIVPVSGGDVDDEVAVRWKSSSSWVGKLIGACIPIV